MTIQQGLAEVHVQRAGTDLDGARVYLFNENAAYLGWSETTDVSGHAEFMLPTEDYKFRIDHNGEKHWSPVIQIQSGEISLVEVDVD